MPKVNAKPRARSAVAVSQDAATPPPTRRGELRREALLEAARAVFLERGYAAASIDDVIKRTGGSKATVYQYFGNKEGLFGAMVAGQCETFIQEVAFPQTSNAPRSMKELEQALVGLGMRALKVFLKPERLALNRAMIAAAHQFPDLAERFYDAGPRRGLAALGAFFKAQHEAGTLHCPDPELAAIHFMDIVRAYPLLRSLLGMTPTPKGVGLEDFVRDAVRTFLYGRAARS
ncbi:MAG TPA: TetR/AcrR family transcriptional regulator [Solimonas sp.]